MSMNPTLVDRPLKFPGVCLDGRHDGPCVDTHISRRPFGNIYFSRVMARDVARAFPALIPELAAEAGWTSPEDRAELERRLADAEGQLAELRPVADSIARAAAAWKDEQ